MSWQPQKTHTEVDPNAVTKSSHVAKDTNTELKQIQRTLKQTQSSRHRLGGDLPKEIPTPGASMNPRQVVTGEAQRSGVHLRWEKQERVQGRWRMSNLRGVWAQPKGGRPPRQHRECLLYSV